MNSGIYKITMGPYYYYGSSTRLTTRKGQHLLDLRNGRHHNRFMQRVYAKNPGAFSFDVIRHTSVDDLLSTEQTYLDEFKDDPFCMNASTVAASVFFCPRARDACIKANKTRVWTDEMRAKASASHEGRIVSAETKALQSARRKGTDNANSRLSTTDITEMIRLRKEGTIIAELADRFKVDRTTVQRVMRLNGVTMPSRKWTTSHRAKLMEAMKRRDPEVYRRNAGGVRKKFLKLRPEDVTKIRLMHDLSHAAVGRLFGVHENTIALIRHGQTWKKYP